MIIVYVVFRTTVYLGSLYELLYRFGENLKQSYDIFVLSQCCNVGGVTTDGPTCGTVILIVIMYVYFAQQQKMTILLKAYTTNLQHGTKCYIYSTCTKHLGVVDIFFFQKIDTVML